ncbi:MAG: tetratricopeptide repeat protein [Pleurocapsa minor GSE-CHR-MK-17-07R]|nr:tetratricopeptide repeat protein [Pleurocapsa minor GSE-CHR-MK 17-07R]
MFDNIDLSKMSEAEIEALFAKMSPDEMNTFLESLARRQGATEGLTSETSMNIAEVDPATAKIDGPGYVPYSEGNRAPRDERPAAPAVAAAPPAPAPVSTPPPAPVAPPQPAASLPEAMPEDDSATRVQPAAQAGSLAWLENLASGGLDLMEPAQEDLFNLNLDDIESAAAPSAPARAAVNTESWLQDLARSQGELSLNEPPAIEGDTLEWLESIAVNQGASRDEFITGAGMSISPPGEDVEPLAYTPFSFETPRASTSPEDFLKSLSMEQGYSEAGVTATQRAEDIDPFAPDAIQEALNSGNVTPEQVAVFFERSMDRGLSQPEPEPVDNMDDVAADAPLAAAEMPSWLLEGISAAEEEEKSAAPATGTIPLDELLPSLDLTGASAQAPNMMDWLGDDQMAGNLNALPDDPTDLLQAIGIGELTPDTSDPWVEALDSEHEAGSGDIDNPPAWYVERTSDPDRMARVEELALGESASAALTDESLSDAPLPEHEDLPFGTPANVPEWLNVSQPMPIVDAASLFTGAAEPTLETAETGIPSWITQAIEEPIVEEASDVPWWEQGVSEPVATIQDILPEAEPTPAPVAAAPEPPRPAPAPAPVAAPRPPVVTNATLEGARTRQRSGDLDGSLREYEAIVQSQQHLDEAITDLVNLAKVHRANPVVHRILGDGYMRQGQLQKALDTYREALNNL